MEELLAYAILLGEGFEVGGLYELFLASPEDRNQLELELLSGNKKASSIYIRIHMDCRALDRRRFGKALMDILKSIYEIVDVQTFASRTFWGTTPRRGRRSAICGRRTGGY